MRPGEDKFRTVLIPAVEVLPDGSRREITVRTQHFAANIIDEPLEHPNAAADDFPSSRKFVQPEGKYSFVERNS